ncbi:MAG: Gfo/Idh/MocA family protein [Candidatus Cyclobacteriaceae bacterium M3_2C_046]
MNSRRRFLSSLASSAISIPVVAHGLSARSFNLLDKPVGPVLKVAIMGLGSYGTRVAEAMQACKRAKLTGVISGTPEKIKTWQEKYGIPAENCYNYQNYHQVKENPEIDAIYVITPNGLHYEHVLGVAQAGKHAICEKPMANTASQGQEMVDACKAAGVKLLIGYRMHFEPKTLEIIRMRKDGDFGKIMFFQGLTGFRIGSPDQWRFDKELAGGGAMMDIGIYSINGARYMIGEEPVWVTAQENTTEPEKFKNGIDETIQFQLGFPGGAVASCLSTYNMRYLDRFYLNGEKGLAQLHPATGYGPIQGSTHLGSLDHPHITHQTVQMDEMASMILDGKTAEVPVDGAEGVKDMKIIEAIYQAVKTGEKVNIRV